MGMAYERARPINERPNEGTEICYKMQLIEQLESKGR